MALRVGSVLETSSKFVVLLSAGVAVAFQTSLAARGWPAIEYMAIAAFLVAFLVTRWSRRWGWALLFGTVYLVPVTFRALRGEYIDPFSCVWLAGCVGGIFSDVRSLRWAWPPQWRTPLAYWALVVATVWPLLIMREADFHWALMDITHIANSGLGGPPKIVSMWMLQVALTHLLGLLWFNSTFEYKTLEDHRAFARDVVAPLGVGALLGCALAVYQGAVDVAFLSDHQWPSVNRAAGSLVDGDAFGALAAVWTLMFPAMAFAIGRARRGVIVFCLVGTLLAWGGMWATGSRIAFAATLIGLMSFAWIAVRQWRQLDGRRRVVSAAVVLVSILAGAGALSRFESDDPLSRLLETLPAPTRPAWEKFVDSELWNRTAPFGSTTVRILRDYPLVGIGVGCFNHMFTDIAYQIPDWRGQFVHHKGDNAQSWYRHQLAELGWVGSLGWLVWLLTFTWRLIRSGGAPETRNSATLIKGALVAIALVSLVAMPTQPYSMALTVWVLAAWFLSVSPIARMKSAQASVLTSTPAWIGVWLLTAVFLVATNRVSATQLRPPQRAVMGEWGYRYGFHDLERPAGAPAFWWTNGPAVDVLPVEPGKWLKVVVKGGPPDVAEHPMRLTIKSRMMPVADLQVASGDPHTWYIEIRPNERFLFLEIETGRVWEPRDFGGGSDDRVLGVQVEEWSFVDAPPAGAVRVPAPAVGR